MAKTKEIKLKTAVKVPILVLVIDLLLALTDSMTFLWGDSQKDVLISSVVVQILVLILPTLFYCRLTQLSFTRKLKLKFFSPGRIILLISLLGVMICGSLLINLVCYSLAGRTGQFSASSAYALSEQVGGMNPLYVLLAFCLVPAVCEEFVFRGVVLSEYSGDGPWAGVLLSALLFAMSHFHLLELPSYLFCGIVLAGAVYATKSLYAAILLHFANNLFSIYVAPYIWTVVLEPKGPLFTGFLIATVFLFCLAISFREAESAYYEYAYDPAYADPMVRTGGAGKLLRALASPTLILCALLFLIVTLLTG